MANEYAVNQRDLKTVADAIRAKAGIADTLVFPSGFADAVAAIASGDGGMDMDVGEIVLEATEFTFAVPTTKRRKYAVALLDGNPFMQGLTAYQICAGMACAGADGAVGYGGNLYIDYKGTGFAGGGYEEGYALENTRFGPVFNDDNVQMVTKVAGTNANVWAAGVTYKYLAWG